MRKIAVVFLMFFLSLGAAGQNKKEFASKEGKYTVQFYDSNIIRISFRAPSFRKNENISDAVIMKPSARPGRQEVRLSGGHLIISYAGGKIHIDPFKDSAFRGFEFDLTADEKIFGGGERALPLNRRGYKLELYNNPWYGYGEGADKLNYSVPFITSSKGYGIFFDNPSRSYVDIGKNREDKLKYGAVSGELNAYIIFGDYRQVLQSYHRLTGTQPLPPRWVLGNLMSRFGYTSEAQVTEIYNRMKQENIPVDAVIFDLFWFGDSIKGTLGNLDWINKSKWPDPHKMIAGFKKDGVQTILVTEPFFVETSKNYKASKPFLAVDSLRRPYYLTDFYFGRGGLIDIFRADARQWFWQFYRKQMILGVEAWWGDLGEPEKHPQAIRHNLKDLGHQRLFAADEVHNLYGHTWTKMLYNFYEKEFPQKRLFSLNRSGFAGSQRYGIYPWTGDVGRNWSGLRAQLPILLGMSMSGVPFIHSDAGGFAGGDGDTELYVRWLQFAAFTPVFRPHGTALYEVDPSARSFPSEPALFDEPYRTHAKNAVNMHYLFMPYNYSMAYQQTVSGKPLMAPMYYYFSNDSAAYNAEAQYMWGENILVAPVVEKGAEMKRVYLPEGKWLHIFSSKVYDGGQWLNMPVQIGNIPVFTREGGFVPTVSRIRNVSEYLTNGQFLLNYFPSTKRTEFTWFEDDGMSKQSLSQGKYTLLHCAGQDVGDKIIVDLSPSNNQFVPSSLAIGVTMQAKPSSVALNGKTIPVLDNPGEVSGRSGEFAHWIPSISTLQVHTVFNKYERLVIEIRK